MVERGHLVTPGAAVHRHILDRINAINDSPFLFSHTNFDGTRAPFLITRHHCNLSVMFSEYAWYRQTARAGAAADFHLLYGLTSFHSPWPGEGCRVRDVGSKEFTRPTRVLWKGRPAFYKIVVRLHVTKIFQDANLYYINLILYIRCQVTRKLCDC